jgi:hypothetical protein
MGAGHVMQSVGYTGSSRGSVTATSEPERLPLRNDSAGAVCPRAIGQANEKGT